MASVLVNTRGTLLTIDPVQPDVDMPILTEMPITPTPYRALTRVTHSERRASGQAAAAPVMTRSAAYE